MCACVCACVCVFVSISQAWEPKFVCVCVCARARAFVGVDMGGWVCTVYQMAVVLCTTRNSPLATSVTGNAKDILATCVAWLVIGL